MATIDYMIASYGPYSASATGGNGLARDFLAGVAAMYSMPCKSYFGVNFQRVCKKLTWCLSLHGYPKLRSPPTCMAYRHSRVSRSPGHNTYFRFLLEGTGDPSEIEVRSDSSQRP